MSMESVRSTRFTTAVRVALLVLSCIALAPAWSNATIFWEDGFEPGNTGYAVVGGMSLSSSPVYSGTYSLKQHFVGNHVQGGTYSDRYLGTSTEDLWSRYYIYLDNFIADPTQTKIMLQGDECCYPSFWWGMLFGQTTLSVQIQGINGGSETVNIYGPQIPQNRWVCVETHIRMSAPGVANGVIEAWLDGVQGITRYDLPMREASFSGGNSPTAKFTYNRLYVQYGQGDLYFDNLAVGNQRIGCSGTPPQISNPAPPPQNPIPSSPMTSQPPPQSAPTPPPTPQDLRFQ